MKLSVWAKKIGIHYKTAWRMFDRGQIEGAVQLPTGTIVVLDHTNDPISKPEYVAVYARVSSSQK
jgi:predicted site-specific integrase-resolvase